MIVEKLYYLRLLEKLYHNCWLFKKLIS